LTAYIHSKLISDLA